MILTKPSGFLFCFDSYFLRNFHNDAAAPLRSEVVKLAVAEVAAQLQTTANKAGSPAEAENEEECEPRAGTDEHTEPQARRANPTDGICQDNAEPRSNISDLDNAEAENEEGERGREDYEHDEPQPPRPDPHGEGHAELRTRTGTLVKDDPPSSGEIAEEEQSTGGMMPPAGEAPQSEE